MNLITGFLLSLLSLILSFFGYKGIPVTSRPTSILPTPISSPMPSPSPRPLTFSELNSLYGPCISFPVLMYHHIQDPEVAKKSGYLNLSVDSKIFRSQLGYLMSKGYSAVTPSDLINFFDQGVSPPKKSVLLTFDDGYEDFYSQAFPILMELHLKATVFLPTGLVGNPRYLIWPQVTELANSGIVYFANHTWSHKGVGVAKEVMEMEISTADEQLASRGLNGEKVFAYPYGNPKEMAEVYLGKLGYKVAFTTRPGKIQCKKQRFELSRTRVGNSSLSAYGL